MCSLASSVGVAVGCERAMMMLVVCRYVLNHLLPSGQSAVICPHIHEVSFFSLAFFAQRD